MSGPVSIVTVAGWDANPCGGTHVRAAGEIGPLRLAGCEAGKVRFEID
jgi:Ser-tRNA(Ala) deacylase AlaX